MIGSNLMNLKFLPSLPYGSYESLIALLAVCIVGLFCYRRDPEFTGNPIVKRYTLYIGYVLFSVVLSMATCGIFWHQTIYQSFITYRSLITFFLYFTLIGIKPTEKDVIDGFKYFTYLFAVVAVCIWVFNIRMTRIEFDKNAETSMNNAIPGTIFLLFYFYILLGKLSKEFTWKDLIIVSLIQVYYVLNQNRSILFVCILFFIYTMFFRAKTGKVAKVAIIAVIAFLLSSYWFMFQDLIDETQQQADAKEYVRWQMMDYCLHKMSPNIWCDLFGNGIISKHTSPSLWNMLYIRCWNFNDVGWYGYYALFGIFGIAAMANLIFRFIFSRNSSADIRMMSIHFLVPTIWAFWQSDAIVLFCLVAYIYIYRYAEKEEIKASDNDNEIESEKILTCRVSNNI